MSMSCQYWKNHTYWKITVDASSCTPQAAAASLQKCKVCTAENCLCAGQRINFTSACLLAHFEILQQPIAFRMQGLDVLKSGHQRFGGGALLLGVRLHLCAHLSFRLRLVGRAL